MQIYSEQSVCSYLPDRDSNIHYFFANPVSAEELNFLLENGWRKFGSFYFRDDCEDCYQCIPIRIPVELFAPSKSQRRILKQNKELQVKFGPIQYTDEIYQIYLDHSKNRFGNESSLEQFLFNFCKPSCPALQSEYYLNGELVGVGYLDRSSQALSSVYFIYKTKYMDLSLGNYSILREIEYTREIGLKYYYLGYYVAGNKSMQYKNCFFPNEQMSWYSGQWILYKD